MDTNKSEENARPGQYGYIEILSVPIEEAIDTGKSPEMLPDEVYQEMLRDYGILPPLAESSPSDHNSPS